MGIFPVERMMVSAARQGEETPAGPVLQLEPVPGAPSGGGERGWAPPAAASSLRMSCGHRSAAQGEGDYTGWLVTFLWSVSRRACLGDWGSWIDFLTPETALAPGGGGNFWRMRAVGLDTSSLV